MFLNPSSHYKYRGDNLQHSVVNNNEIQQNRQCMPKQSNQKEIKKSNAKVWWPTTAIRKNDINLIILD